MDRNKGIEKFISAQKTYFYGFIKKICIPEIFSLIHNDLHIYSLICDLLLIMALGA